LTGGLDGAAPADADYVGTEANAQGLHALDKTTDINFVCVPGVTTTAVQQGGVDYAAWEKRQDIIFLVDPPLTMDLADEIRDWRLNTLNRDTSYAALYYPWIQINDPEVDGQLLYLPPSGHVMGVYSAVARVTGPHTPPANIAIAGINGVSHETSDPEHDLLNPVGVNVIRPYPGEGIRIMGARTLQNAQDGKHYVNVRNLTNFIKKSLKVALRQYLMQAIDPSLWGRIQNTCDGFLLGIWRSGWLFPSDNQDQAFFAKCDSENNPQDVVNQGRVNVAVGFNPPFPAEFIVLRLSRIGGTVEVSE
jgi:phage tail sheath protein FI